MAINNLRSGTGVVRSGNTTVSSNGKPVASTTTRPLNQSQSGFQSAPAKRGPNLGSPDQPVAYRQAATATTTTAQTQSAPKPQFDFDVNAMRSELGTVAKDINTEKYKHNGVDVSVDRSGDSTDRASKLLLEALLDPAKAAEILKNGIPGEGVSPPQPRSAADLAAAQRAEAELAAKEGRPPQPIAPSLHEVLTKVANGQPITKEEMQQMGGVVKTWSKGNRMVLDGFYAGMLAAAKRENRQW